MALSRRREAMTIPITGTARVTRTSRTEANVQESETSGRAACRSTYVKARPPRSRAIDRMPIDQAVRRAVDSFTVPPRPYCAPSSADAGEHVGDAARGHDAHRNPMPVEEAGCHRRPVPRRTDGPHCLIPWDVLEMRVDVADEQVGAVLEVARVPLGLLADVEDSGPLLFHGRGELVDGRDRVGTERPSGLDPGGDAPLKESV